MSDLKHETFSELRILRVYCKKYIASLVSQLSGQKERLKWIDKYINDKEQLTMKNKQWKIVYNEHGFPHIENCHGQWVCDLSFYDENSFPQHTGFVGFETNANLIVAAPELLNVLEIITTILEEGKRPGDLFVKDARKAINSAKGIKQ